MNCIAMLKNAIKNFFFAVRPRLGLRKYMVNRNRWSDFGDVCVIRLDYYNRELRWRRRLDRKIDMRSCIMNLSSVIETVLNSTVVQLVRCKMGVEMPAYYNCLKRGYDACRIKQGERRNIELNRCVRNLKGRMELKKVSIGDISRILLVVDYVELTPLRTEDFIILIRDIGKLRNDIEHRSSLDINESFVKMFELYRELERYDYHLKRIRNNLI